MYSVLSGKHTSLYALFLRSRMTAEERAFHADFSPTTTNNMWKLSSPARQRVAVSSVGREDPSLQASWCNNKKAPTKCRQGEKCPGETWIEDTLKRFYFCVKYSMWGQLMISHEAFFSQRNLTEMRFFLELEGSWKKEMISVLTTGQTSLCSPSASFRALETQKCRADLPLQFPPSLPSASFGLKRGVQILLWWLAFPLYLRHLHLRKLD